MPYVNLNDLNHKDFYELLEEELDVPFTKLNGASKEELQALEVFLKNFKKLSLRDIKHFFEYE
jgi:hypothetical protein